MIGLYANDESYVPVDLDTLDEGQVSSVLRWLHRFAYLCMPLRSIATISTRLQNVLERSNCQRLIDFADGIPTAFIKQRGLGHKSWEELRGYARTYGMVFPEWYKGAGRPSTAIVSFKDPEAQA